MVNPIVYTDRNENHMEYLLKRKEKEIKMTRSKTSFSRIILFLQKGQDLWRWSYFMVEVFRSLVVHPPRLDIGYTNTITIVEKILPSVTPKKLLNYLVTNPIYKKSATIGNRYFKKWGIHLHILVFPRSYRWSLAMYHTGYPNIELLSYLATASCDGVLCLPNHGCQSCNTVLLLQARELY